MAQYRRLSGGAGMNVLIVEDEAVAARRLERLTRRILGDATRRLEIAYDLDGARAALEARPFDLILLDLQLAGEDGFDVLAARTRGAPVVIVSAYSGRAVEAFQHAVLDFVPKPVVEERLRQAIDRARAVAEPRARSRLIVRAHGRVDFVDVDTIVRATGADDYCELLLASGRTLLSERRLSELETDLPSATFLRVHRSHAVNLKFVERLERRAGRAVLLLRGGVESPISRRRLDDVAAKLEIARSS